VSIDSRKKHVGKFTLTYHFLTNAWDRQVQTALQGAEFLTIAERKRTAVFAAEPLVLDSGSLVGPAAKTVVSLHVGSV